MSLSITQLRALQDAIAHSTTASVVTVVELKGSAPREVGTPMVVLPNSIVGTIGGGRLEYVAIEFATQQPRLFDTEPLRQRYPLGDSLGQCCGGSVELLYERVKADWKDWVAQAITAYENNQPFERVTEDGFIHRIQPPDAHLILCGAGHVGRALVNVLADAPITVHWIDERADEFLSTIPSNVLVEVTDTPESVIQQAPKGSAVLVTTHRHDLDFDLVTAAIARNDLAYCGMIGSRSKRARFERQWQQRHAKADTADLQKLTCPIGASGPVGKEPTVVAIAVACEILLTLQS